MVGRPIFVAFTDSAFGQSLKRHAHHAVGHRQIARFRHDLAIQQNDAVRVSPGMGLVGTSAGQPSGTGAVRTGVANIGVKGLYFQRSDFRVGTGKSAMA